ncbi:DUF2199 domain-containing protein [Trichocoleus desertorum]|uniref:DUF2199 domain-containing protein n=1 Tax=Trichocoleus desertorum GB2-A4 TaxID=2933944 RepID=A0ABV0JH35_9CYAN|nr:DUF2199 domain-containing protein [Trichocoleus sp. FACHB-46]
MKHYRCTICEQDHSDVPMDIAQPRPIDYYAIPPEARDERITITADLCCIDDKRYFLRGYMPIPVQDSPEVFGWGVWTEVEENSFYRYIELYEVDGTKEPPFPGLLSAALNCYQPSTYQLPLYVQLRGAQDRPLLSFPEQVQHPLAQEQRDGITMARVYEILHQSLPNLLTNE